MATCKGSVKERTGLNGFDVALDAHVAEDEEARLRRCLAEDRVGGDEEGEGAFSSVSSQIMSICAQMPPVSRRYDYG